MTSTVATLLQRLHEQSIEEVMARARAQFQGSNVEFMTLADEYDMLVPRLRGRLLESHGLSSEDSEASQGTHLSLAITPDTGRFLRNMVLAHRPARILELGSSRGVSTLYLADALSMIGSGVVVATELDPEKCMQLRAHVSAAGVERCVDLIEGDVFETVSELQGTFDMVFIDVWADAYLPLFRRTEHLLRPGSIVLADNMYTAEDTVQPYRDYLAGNPRYSTMTLDYESGIEFTVVMC